MGRSRVVAVDNEQYRDWVHAGSGRSSLRVARASARSPSFWDSEVEYRPPRRVRPRPARRAVRPDLLLRDLAPGREPARACSGSLRRRLAHGGYVLPLETYGVVNRELEPQAAMHVCEAGISTLGTTMSIGASPAKAWLVSPTTPGFGSVGDRGHGPVDRRPPTDHRHAGRRRVTTSHSRNTGGAASLVPCLYGKFQRFYAHRLGRAYGPDSSAMALAGSLAAGVDGLETDVCLTADGELVLLHDPLLTLGTTPDGWAHERQRRRHPRLSAAAAS